MSEPNVLILGPPGAGKGTQSERIAEAFDVQHITTCGILRSNKDMETDHGTPREYMEAGDLVPDPVMNEIVDKELEEADGFVLDGYPRNMTQVEALEGMTDLDVVLYLTVDREELIRRLTGRRECPECGSTYHVEFEPPETEGICDECGAELVQREDDTEAVVRNRLDVYHENTAPVVEHYEDTDAFVRIDGNGSPDEVWDAIEAAVEAAT